MVFGQGGLSGLHRGDITFDGMGLQGQTDGSSERHILNIHALNRDKDQGRLSMNAGPSLQPMRQGRISTENFQKVQRD